MSCTAGASCTELQFVTALGARDSLSWNCIGPAVTLTLTGHEVRVIGSAVHSPVAFRMLIDNQDPGIDGDPQFTLCAVHWLDLAGLAGVHGRLYQRSRWLAVAAALVRRVCRHAGWDPKEISNLLGWQQIQLT